MAKKFRFFMKNGQRDLVFSSDDSYAFMNMKLRDGSIMEFNTVQGNRVYINGSEVQAVFVYGEDE